MLSIAIPVYNYDIRDMVQSLHGLLKSSAIDFEILLFDDASQIEISTRNKSVESFSHINYIISKTNVGRTQARQILAERAQYNWLLFMDADVIPKNDNFFKKFTNAMQSDVDLIFGGIDYQSQRPVDSEILRWHYGKEREAKSLNLRIKNPYSSIVSACFLIKKQIFLNANSHLKQQNQYGLDLRFASLLAQQNVRVLHIENPVYHLGLESSTHFILKSKSALETLKTLVDDNKIPINASALLRSYDRLKRFKLHQLFGKLMIIIEPQILNQIKGKNPNLFLFDLFRLGYLCRINTSL